MKLSKLNKIYLLLGVFIVIKQLLWTAIIPVWQFPDEQAHFAQVQNSVELGVWNPSKFTTSEEIVMSQIFLGTLRDSQGNNKFTHRKFHTIEYTDTKNGLHEHEIKNLPFPTRKNLLIQEATYYPPLYYSIAGIGYKLFYKSDLIMRLFGARLMNIFLSVAFFIISIKLVRQFTQNGKYELSLVFLINTVPMFSFVSAGVNSDVLFNLLGICVLTLGLAIIKNGLKKSLVFSSIAVLFLSYLTKPQMPIFLFILFSAFFIHQFVYVPQKRKRLVISTGILIFVFLIIIFNSNTIQEVNSLREIKNISLKTFINHFIFTLKHSYREVLPWFWGVFRWLSLTYDRIVYRILNLFTLISFIGIILSFINKRNSYKNVGKKVFLATSIIIYFSFLTLFDYFFQLKYGYSIGIQGRYFFPIIGAIICLLYFGLVSFFVRMKISINTINSGLITLMAFFHSYALFFVANSYTKTSSIQMKFLQLSQYKPLLFKSPNLESLVGIYVILAIVVVLMIIKYERSATS